MIEIGTTLSPCDSCGGHDDNANVAVVNVDKFRLVLTLCQPCRGMLVDAVQMFDEPIKGDDNRVHFVRIEEPIREER